MASDFDTAFDAAGRQYNVDPKLLKTVFLLESSGNPNTPDSSQGAQGGMQMLPATARAMGATNPRDMTQAIPAAARYLAQGLDATGSPQGALAYYHGGPDRSIWGPKTAAYVAKGAATYPNVTLAGGQVVAQQPKQAAADPFSATLTAPGQQDAPDAFSATVGGSDPVKDAPDAFSATLAAPAQTQQEKTIAPQTSASGIGASILRGVHDATDVPATALASGADWVAHKLGYDTNFAQDAQGPAQQFNQSYDSDPNNQSLPNKVARFGGNALVTLPAAIGAGNIAEGAVGAGGILSGANKLVPWIAPVASGAVQGATVAGMNGEPVGRGAETGAIVGGILAAGGRIANRLLTTDQPMVEAAVNKYGIPLRSGQTSDSKFVRYLDSQVGNLPGSGQEASNAAQRTAFNRAVAGTFGESADKITPAVMQSAKDRIGAGLNAIESGHNISIAPVLNDLAETEAKWQGSLTNEEYGVVRKLIDGVLKNVQDDGTISGETFGNLIGHKSPLSAALSSQNGSVKAAASEIKDALQDAMQQSLPTEVANEYAALRLQYKNLMTVAPLVNRGVPGDISPTLLQSAANRSYKQNAFRGAGDLGELGDIGQTYLKAPPDSGTATRMMVNGLTGFGAAANVAKGLTGVTAGRVAGSVLRSNPLTGPTMVPGVAATTTLLRNRLLGPPDVDVTR